MQSNIPDINQYIQRALTSKNAQKPSVEALRELQRIENLDVSDFSEADVREEIINPILVLLGYQKGKYSSLDREKYLNIAGKKKFIDYSMKLWEKHYWLIEAKNQKRVTPFRMRIFFKLWSIQSILLSMPFSLCYAMVSNSTFLTERRVSPSRSIQHEFQISQIVSITSLQSLLRYIFGIFINDGFFDLSIKLLKANLTRKE
jgi:hypothetical protein